MAANDGTTFPVAHHVVFEAEIITAFGGFTLLLSGVRYLGIFEIL